MPVYLVTGGAGFIGRALCRVLLAAGQHVRVLDDLSQDCGKDRLPPGTTFVRGDITREEILLPALQGVDGVFHLAARPAATTNQMSRVIAMHSNVIGTMKVVNAARALGVPMVMASSARVYQSAGGRKIRESHPQMPLDGYANDKLAAEMHARSAKLLHRQPVICVRLFEVYGEDMPSDTPYAVPVRDLLRQLPAEGPIMIRGSATEAIDLLHVDDAAACLVAAMRHVDSAPPVVNACTGQGTTLNSFLNLLHDCLPEREIRYEKTKTDCWKSPGVGDPSLAEEILSVKPKLGLQQGLVRLPGVGQPAKES
jgi:UDP-glucose 4-epimerase